jgi:predicted DNA repair protein MutK
VSAGLFGLLDDVAVLARAAAASIDDIGAAAGRASMKAAGVVVDDTAVTPQYVRGVAAERELPIVKKIAIGSLRNKLVFILPAALLLSQFAPDWVLPVILVFGGAFLAFEGAEKVWARISGHGPAEEEGLGTGITPEQEKTMVAGAVRTDFILSAEIMVISLNSVAEEPFATRAAVLVVVAIAITILVYGVVALIVKMDDAGIALAQRPSDLAKRVGTGLVKAMPRLLTTLTIVGTAAMLWVGGHIIVEQLHHMDDPAHPDARFFLGWSGPYDLIHHLEHEAAHAIEAIGGLVGWLVNTALSAVVGLVVGGVVVAVMHVLPFGKEHGAH